MGWQKRGKGHNSLTTQEAVMVLSSGHCWTIQQRQKVVDFVIVPKPWKNNLKLMIDEKIMRPRQKQWSLLQELNCLTELQTKVFSFQFTGWWWLMMMMMIMKHTFGKSDLWAWKNSDIIHMKRWMKWNKMKWNEESWMRGQQMYPLTIHLNMWTVSSDVSIQRRHWQPLSVHLWAYCTHPTHDVNDVMCEGWPQHRGLRPLLFSNSGVGSFTSHKNQISVSAVRRDLRFFVLIRED